jgi:hypothetical protein
MLLAFKSNGVFTVAVICICHSYTDSFRYYERVGPIASFCVSHCFIFSVPSNQQERF